MALTSAQKARCRLLLGAPDNFRYEDTRLESVLGNLSSDAEAQVLALIANIDQVDAKIVSFALNVLGLRRVDEIWFGTGQNPVFDAAKSIGRSYIAQLSIILGVPIMGDYYGSTGYPGDFFTWGGGVPGSGRGGPINLG